MHPGHRPPTASSMRAGQGGLSAAKRGVTLSILLLSVAAPALAQVPTAGGSPQALRLSLADAVGVALVQSYAIRLSKIDQAVGSQQVREAFASFFPKLDANASYQRTFLTPNPFAGSDAADIFSGLSPADWVAYNQRVQRQLDDPAGIPPGERLEADVIQTSCPGAVAGGALRQISFGTYIECLQAGQRAAGAGPVDPDANPFLVENTIRAGLTLTQLVYDGSAFAALRGARASNALNSAQLKRTGHRVVRDVAAAYYGVLLARASVEVIEKSVKRNRQTVTEVSARFKEGVVPQFQLLSAEVELANLETQLVTTRDRAESSEDNLAFVLGVPLDTRIELTDPLEIPDPHPPLPESTESALEIAVTDRPDLEASRQAIELQLASESVAFSDYLPELRLVVNLNVVGTIPDDRSRIFAPAPMTEDALLSDNPFVFESEERGFFNSDFWGTNLTAGLNLTWTLFDGFATPARHKQQKLETMRARIQLEQLQASIRQEVASERRNVSSALERVRVQVKNVERAELNYRHAELRVKEGVSTQLELREASDQLDQSRFNKLQAVHDYLVARTSFEVAIGRPPFRVDEEGE